MTGRELEDKLNYLGMERKLRKLALEKKLETAEKIAVMTTTEVCDLVLKEYEVVYTARLKACCRIFSGTLPKMSGST